MDDEDDDDENDEEGLSLAGVMLGRLALSGGRAYHSLPSSGREGRFGGAGGVRGRGTEVEGCGFGADGGGPSRGGPTGGAGRRFRSAERASLLAMGRTMRRRMTPSADSGRPTHP